MYFVINFPKNKFLYRKYKFSVNFLAKIITKTVFNEIKQKIKPLKS